MVPPSPPLDVNLAALNASSTASSELGGGEGWEGVWGDTGGIFIDKKMTARSAFFLEFRLKAIRGGQGRGLEGQGRLR